jgi:hypothetical protein
MPTTRPLPGSARRRARTARLVVGLLAGIAGSAVALPASPGLAAGPDAAASDVRGVLERLAVDRDDTDRAGHPFRSGAILTWLHAGTRHLRVPAEAVAGVPTGSALAVRFGPTARTSSDLATDPSNGPLGPDRQPVLPVESVSVLTRAAAVTPPRTARTTEPHSVTVILALPPGARPDGVTAAAAAAAVSGGASTFWGQQSDGRFGFTVAKAVGWTALTHPCTDVWGLWDEARQRAGFTAGARKHLMVYVPPSAGCPTGLGTVGDTPDAGGYTFVGGLSTALLAHELGHNLGLGHSDALSCTDSSDASYVQGGFGGRCRHVEYGDWYDVMGISWDHLGSLSTAHAYRLGLLAGGGVSVVTGPAQVILRPVSGRVGVRSVRIQDPAGATYVVEYRPAAGADAWLVAPSDWRHLQPGVLVRRVDPADDTQTLLLDATPSDAVHADTDTDVVLAPGHTLTTASGRVAIQVESVAPGAAVIMVAVDAAWPTLELEPGGRLINGVQVTIGDAPAAWASRAG